MWPFKRKSINQTINKSSDLLRTNYILNTFGTNTVVWDKYIQSGQNDLLLIEKYNSIAEVSAPINKYAVTSKQVIVDTFKMVGKELKPVIDSDHIKIAVEKFWSENSDKLMIYKKLLGNVYINRFEYNNPLSGQKVLFSLLPSQYTKIIPEQKNNADIRTNKAKAYLVSIDSNHTDVTIDAKDILHIKELSPNADNFNYLYGYSPLISCGKNITSIEAGYGAKVSLYQNGPRGIVTGKSQGEFAAANIQSNEDVLDVQKRFNSEYGMQTGQFAWLFTDIPLDVQLISYNNSQLQILENNKADVNRICGALNIDPRAVFSDENNTFDNVKQANRGFLVQSFKSEIDNIFIQLSKYISESYPGYVLKANYSNITEIVDALKENNIEILEQCEKGLLTRNEYFERIGERTIDYPEFNEYATFYNGIWSPVIAKKDESTGVSAEQLQAQANLRGTVGGVEGILNIQNSVAMGITDYDAGVAILVEIYGFTDEVARRVLGNPKKPKEQYGNNETTIE
jgi:phage portal protein BeeE